MARVGCRPPHKGGSWKEGVLRAGALLDLQVFIIEQTELGYPIPKLANASDAIVYGVELDLTSEPIDGLRLTLNAAWVESEYEEFVVTFTDLVAQARPCNRCPMPPPIPVARYFDYSANTLIERAALDNSCTSDSRALLSILETTPRLWFNRL